MGFHAVFLGTRNYFGTYTLSSKEGKSEIFVDERSFSDWYIKYHEFVHVVHSVIDWDDFIGNPEIVTTKDWFNSEKEQIACYLALRLLRIRNKKGHPFKHASRALKLMSRSTRDYAELLLDEFLAHRTLMSDLFEMESFDFVRNGPQRKKG